MRSLYLQNEDTSRTPNFDATNKPTKEWNETYMKADIKCKKVPIIWFYPCLTTDLCVNLAGIGIIDGRRNCRILIWKNIWTMRSTGDVKVLHVGLLCVQKLGEDRRPISTIFQCSAAKLLNFPHRRSPHLSEAPLRSSLSHN